MNKLLKQLRGVKLLTAAQKGAFDKSFIYIFSIALFILSNLLLQSLSMKADFSRGKAYTLSSSTKKQLNALDDTLNIKFYVSSELPSRLIPLKTEVVDLLNEFKKENKNKISVKILDPKKDENAKKEVEELGIPELSFSQLEKDKYQLTAAYFGLSVSYEGKKEALPQVTDLGNLEYNITSLIYRLTKKELQKVAIIGAPPGPNAQEDPYAILKTVLSTQYEVSDLDTAPEDMKEISPLYNLVILIAPGTSTFEQRQIGMFKNYMDKGGKLVVLTDGVTVNEDLSAAPAQNNLIPLLKNWGITLHSDLVLSTSAEFVNFGNTTYQFFTPYPFWVKTNTFANTTGYFANVPSLTFPWTSSLSVGDQKGQILVQSSKQSWVQTSNFNLYPQDIKEPSLSALKSYDLVAQVNPKGKGTVVLIPSSRFLDARYLGKGSGNIEFAFNLINNLASGGALSGIRSRSLNIYPLPNIPEDQKDMVKYFNILLLPALFAIYGTVRLLRRK